MKGIATVGTVSAFGPAADGVRIQIRLTPKASRDEIVGLRTAGDGSAQLVVKVTAVPEKGKANAALIKLLAKAWKVAPGRFRLVSGETDRNKLLHLEGPPAEMLEQLQAWAAALRAEE